MSGIREAVDEYLTIRRRLGYKLIGAGSLLSDFAFYCERMGVATLSTEAMLAWVKQPANCQPVWWSIRMGVVRRFAAYLHAIDACHEVPPADLFPARCTRATPYLYSAADIGNLIAAAEELRGLQAATYSTAIGLLAVTGMRVGELIRLDREDVDWTEAMLTLRNGKFGKSREVVLDSSTMDVLHAYDQQRRRTFSRPKTAAFFVSMAGTRLQYSELQRRFRVLVRRAGIAWEQGHGRPPRLHDLRHTFAVNTLLGWYRAGVDVAERIHLLSTYMGHSDPANTYWYQSAAPELMALAAERLERTAGELA